MTEAIYLLRPLSHLCRVGFGANDVRRIEIFSQTPTDFRDTLEINTILCFHCFTTLTVRCAQRKLFANELLFNRISISKNAKMGRTHSRVSHGFARVSRMAYGIFQPQYKLERVSDYFFSFSQVWQFFADEHEMCLSYLESMLLI